MSQNILSRYSIEIYTSLGTLIADLSGIASMRQLNLSRNTAGSSSFKIDIHTLQDLAKKLNLSPYDLLAVNRNEIRIRKGTRYLFGGQISYIEAHLESNEVQVQSIGFFDLLADRFTADLVSFSNIDAGQIAWDLINTTQSQLYGSFGITEGTIQTSTNRTLDYQYKKVKDAIVQLSEMNNGFDFEVTEDKVFNVYYPQQGIDQTSTVHFSYPGNIKKFSLSRDGSKMFNRAIVRGSGYGGVQLIQTVENSTYQNAYAVRENILDNPDIFDNDSLISLGQEQLNIFEDNFEIPEIVIDGNQQPFLGTYWIGDRIKIEVNSKLYPMFSYINNLVFKVDSIGVSIDDNDMEEITLTLSKFS